MRVAEAAARSSYIAHRSYLLGEQLKAYTINSPLGDIFKFLKKVINSYGTFTVKLTQLHPVCSLRMEPSGFRLCTLVTRDPYTS